ncbi:MAG: hypothetical protein WB586_01110 [Chthoniobacterales bacterium]
MALQRIQHKVQDRCQARIPYILELDEGGNCYQDDSPLIAYREGDSGILAHIERVKAIHSISLPELDRNIHQKHLMKRPDIMPTSRMATTCMPLTMPKKPQSITPKSTVPSQKSW